MYGSTNTYGPSPLLTYAPPGMSGILPHEPNPHCPCVRRQPRHRTSKSCASWRQGIVTIIGARDLDKGQAAAEKLAADGVDAAILQLDADDQGSVAACIAEIESRYGRLDILVNNAAILIDGPGGFDASLFELTGDTMRKTFETNIFGPLRLTQSAVPLMRKNGYGRIVNVSSGAGQLCDMGMGFPAYRMSKSALNALTRITAAEVKDTNILVNAVCPGWVRTDMGGPQAERMSNTARRRRCGSPRCG